MKIKNPKGYYVLSVDFENSQPYHTSADYYFTNFNKEGKIEGHKFKERTKDPNTGHIFYERPEDDIREGKLDVKDLNGKIALRMNGRTPNPDKVKALGVTFFALHDDIFTFLQSQGLRDLYHEVPIIIFDKKNQHILPDFNRGIIPKQMVGYIKETNEVEWVLPESFDDRLFGMKNSSSLFVNQKISKKILDCDFGNVVVREIDYDK